VGAYSLVAAKFLEGDTKIFAFEPGFSNYTQLQKNVLINSFSDSITPMQIALTERTGLEYFNYANLTPGGALHALGEPIDYKGDVFVPVAKHPVLAYSIDDLIKQFSIPVPNHIKIDVDGIEFSILRGASTALQDPALRTLLIELEDNDPEAEEIIEFLASKGLVFQSRHQYAWGGLDDPLASLYNYIFLRSD
jgi:FkbM family methyltransferase